MAALGGSVLVLTTGRSKGHLMDLLAAKAEIIAVPDVLITAVGTKVRQRGSDKGRGRCEGAARRIARLHGLLIRPPTSPPDSVARRTDLAPPQHAPRVWRLHH